MSPLKLLLTARVTCRLLPCRDIHDGHVDEEEDDLSSFVIYIHNFIHCDSDALTIDYEDTIFHVVRCPFHGSHLRHCHEVIEVRVCHVVSYETVTRLCCKTQHTQKQTQNTQKHKQTFTHKQRNTEHNIKHRLAKKYAMLIITIDIITPTTGFLLIIDICCNHPIDL